MKRELMIPRPDWPSQMEAVGFQFHSIDGIYWDERACYRFSLQEIDTLEAATLEMHQRCLDACAHVIERRRYDEFAIPPSAIPLIEESWRARAPSLMGRFDISWDGNGPPKLLEYNADTPTSLIEASVAQWHWLQSVKPHADQFNSLHEKLLARWQAMARVLPSTDVHLACAGESEEDVGNLDYMADVVTQAGLVPHFVDVKSIGWDAVSKQFVDGDNEPIETLFKLYPWEWMVREAFATVLNEAKTVFVEPPWKLILSNKAILPVLWELFPEHPNLLPCYFSPDVLDGATVKKPLLSREGANIDISAPNMTLQTGGEYGAEGFVYQRYHPLPDFSAEGGNYMVIGSWIIGDEAAGIGIREDESPITKNTSRFLPHYFDD